MFQYLCNAYYYFRLVTFSSPLIILLLYIVPIAEAYIPYWTSTIVDFLLNQSGDDKSMSIMDISKITSIMSDDIIFTMNQLGMLKFVNGVYFISAERSLLEELAKKHPIKEPRVDPSKLHWTPYITDIKRDKFSIHSKKASVEDDTGTY